MRIQHNISAMNSYRNLTNNNSALSKNLEKLSSGYKINRAGDDAAGLAISEKMRAQITGLNAATKNVKDGISLVKTAEGALQEVHDMLNRMVYLAEQSANGTYDDAVDRQALQDEVTSLATEITRIGETANFNGKKLFANGDNLTSQNGGVGIMQLQIGDSAAAEERLDLSVALAGSEDAADLKTLVSTITDGTLNVQTVDAATTLLATLRGGVDTAGTEVTPADGLINQVSSLRGKLGATQNRLEHTQNNLAVMTENIQDAESTIRDTDVAEEMMAYTKNNILIQSAQAMLAQANQVPQGVLQLMQ
ncbi:MAG: flagellin [Firmicutes bacterium]|nr:flagellin [Bacillota bacterium]